MNNKPLNITFFYCLNSVDINDVIKDCGKQGEVDFKTISLPCSGKVNLLYLLKAIETGADGVILMTCKPGECHYLEGNLRAEKRVESVDSLLEETGLSKGHIIAIQPKDDDNNAHIIEEILDFCKKIRNLPQLNTEIV